MDNLTDTEKEIHSLLKQGLTKREISEKLSYSIPTVKKKVIKLYSKLGVKNRVMAVQI